MSSAPRRLSPQPTEVIDRSRTITFTFDGRSYSGHPGDSIVSALLASGVKVFSRSFKYHRPRGVLTAGFHDPGCMMQVGDEPNVRGAHRLVSDGMVVSSQNRWPSLRFDVGAANQTVSRFLTAGFYYKTFIKPQPLWPTYERIISRFAPGGTVSGDSTHGDYDHRFAHPDVVVAGGGPAGMLAALAAADAGAGVMLVEEEHALGGHLRYQSSLRDDLMAILERVESHPGIEVLTDSVVTGRYDDNWVAICQRNHPLVFERLIKARAKILVVAAGLVERPYVFAGNDKPGVMLSTAARRLINLWAVKPGERAVVLTANPEGDAATEDLDRAGVEIAAVVDGRRGHTIVAARGSRTGVKAVEISDGSTVEADLVVTSVGWTAPTSLLNMAGDRPTYDRTAARFFPGDLPENVLVAGGLAGDGSLDELATHSRAIGTEAARRALEIRRRWQAARPWASAPDPETGEAPTAPVPDLPRHPHPEMFRSTTHGMVDYSEDVSSKDLVAAVAEGFDSIELAKRYTTATMGPTQGKLETVNTVAVVADTIDRSIEDVGTTVWRPPYAPITLGALGGRTHEPVRRSPMHSWHEARGATPLVAGQWIRPDHYGNPEEEVRRVRENVGIIDVTPLGKLDLRGPDVHRLLEQVYVNKWSKLPVGGVRYGVMCAEDGVVLDDGVTGRLAEDWYLMTTTSSGAGTIWEWVENWLQTEHPEWRVVVTPVTTAYASMNVAGPKARLLLDRIVADIDLSPDAFGYMNVRRGSIAGIDCFMWRIGFTGELSYEVHVPAGYGLAVWEAIVDAGADLGIGPFGVEAQRIMRLEKGHFIVGQDTDGLMQGFSAGLDWLIKLDKDDFAGKPELTWQAQRTGDVRVVGLQPVVATSVPPEASQIVDHADRIMGRITSARMSPTLGRSVCLGVVAEGLASPGTIVTIRLPDGNRIQAAVMEHHAHFDPEGTRLRG